VIDKTRAVVKDLHSRITVAIYSVDSISKRIEKMRDEELYPQLLELTEGYAKSYRFYHLYMLSLNYICSLSIEC
jgi:hypothetical protein